MPTSNSEARKRAEEANSCRHTADEWTDCPLHPDVECYENRCIKCGALIHRDCGVDAEKVVATPNEEKVVTLAVTEIRASATSDAMPINECDHVTGSWIPFSDNKISVSGLNDNLLSVECDHTEGISDWLWFTYCPKCGEKL